MAKRIMIVDNSYGDRMVLRDHLVSLGHRVVSEARNFKESFDKYRDLVYKEQKPDFIMVDASVPDIDGVAAIIRLLREDPDAVIVICISRGQRALALEAMMVGAKDFITKPYDIRRLRRTINSLPMK